MGNLCSCCFKNSSENNNSNVELSKNSVDWNENRDVTCKCGKYGKGIQQKLENGVISLSGSGTCIGSCCLECDTAYFEVKITSSNTNGVKIGFKKCKVKTFPSLDGILDTDDKESPAWIYNGKQLKENDVIGVYWDQTDLPMVSFSLNGVEEPSANINRIRPANEIFPAISLQDSSCQLIFDEKYFNFQPKSKKFKMIVCASSLI